MRLVTAILAKNEGSPDRYLKRVLQNALSFSDKVLLLDDSSTDNTREIALELGVSVSKRPEGTPAWGAEKSARQELWEWGAKEAKDGWLLIQDADMILKGDPRPYCLSWELTAWALGVCGNCYRGTTPTHRLPLGTRQTVTFLSTRASLGASQSVELPSNVSQVAEEAVHG